MHEHPPRANGAPSASPQVPQVDAPPREKTRAQLRAMSRTELIAYFHRLNAPALREMDGEFSATLLDQGSLFLNVGTRIATHLPGRWLAKGFEPKTALEGHGYNVFRRLIGLRRWLRMKTFIGASNVDGRPSYFLEYGAFNGGPLGTMVDEVRRIGPGRYLGLGRLGYTKRQRAYLFPFLLEGPVASFSRR